MVYNVQIAKKNFLTPLLYISLEHPQVLDIQRDSYAKSKNIMSQSEGFIHTYIGSSQGEGFT